jgi:hypothetical protein
MAERKQGREESQRPKEPRRDRHVQFAEVVFSALYGEASGEHLITPESTYSRGSTTGMYGEVRRIHALQDLAEGGYVIDLRPLAEHPQLVSWVMRAPMASGQMEGSDIDRLPDEVRQATGDMATGSALPQLEGAFRFLGLAAASRIFEPEEGTGPFDYVSAPYRAAWWGSRGALIGKRVGDSILSSAGRQQAIEPFTPPPASPQSGRRT